jgi:hypothetical protein
MRMSDQGPGPGLGDGWRGEPSSWVDPQQVHVTRIDVPFLELTWFFIKSSLALALAFSVTSWLWVMIATGIASLLAGLLYLVGVPQLMSGQPFAPPALMAPGPTSPEPGGSVVGGEPVLVPGLVVGGAHPEPALQEPGGENEPVPSDAPAEDAPAAEAKSAPERTGEGATAADPNASATEALQREELERARRARQ